MYFISAPSYYLEFFSEEHEPTYATLGTGWYMYTGGMIAKNLVIEMFAPHITPLLFIIFYKGRLLYDRGCTCNKKRSKQLDQEQYEHYNMGPDFILDMRLAQIIALTWTTLMYSSGIPLLYLEAALCFGIMYWVDKFLIFRFYRTPKNFGQTTIDYTTLLLKASVIVHFWFAYQNFHNKDIFESPDTDLLSWFYNIFFDEQN